MTYLLLSFVFVDVSPFSSVEMVILTSLSNEASISNGVLLVTLSNDGLVTTTFSKDVLLVPFSNAILLDTFCNGNLKETFSNDVILVTFSRDVILVTFSSDVLRRRTLSFESGLEDSSLLSQKSFTVTLING